MRSVTLFFLVAAIVISLGTPAVAQKSMLEVVKERGVLKAGIKNDLPAFGFTDEKGNIVGFDVDIAREIAKRLGVKFELEPVTSATRIALLQQGRVDLLAANVSHYRKRDEVVDFSISYFYTPQTILVKKTSAIKGLPDLAGKRVGTLIGAATVQNLKKAQPKVTVQTYEGLPDAFLALQKGMVDAIGTDAVALASVRANAPNPDDFKLLGKAGEFGGGYWGIAIRENDSKWRDAINFMLQDMWLDGTWDKIFDKWVGKDSKLKLKKEELGFEMEIWQE